MCRYKEKLVHESIFTAEASTETDIYYCLNCYNSELTTQNKTSFLNRTLFEEPSCTTPYGATGTTAIVYKTKQE